jgi:predicted signal transduction protein with EAL and GGDEF domain
LCARGRHRARPGGDEFTILLYDISALATGTVAEKSGATGAPMTIAAAIVVTTSIASRSSRTIRNSRILMKNADLAMHRAKDRTATTINTSPKRLEGHSRLRTENESEALEFQFELFYQPKVWLADQRITGVEALIRWHHPELGLVTPDNAFTLIFTGIIVGIGAWVNVDDRSAI